MKLAVVIISLFVAQTSAMPSFYDFRTFDSLQNSFEKLLSDVVTDVKVTIDCTIMAVEEALSLNGMFGDHKHYDKYCKAQSDDIIAQSAAREAKEITKDLSHHFEESVAEIDKTIESLLDKRVPEDKQFHIDIKQIVEDEPKKETVDDLPKDFRTVVKKIVDDDISEVPKDTVNINAAIENNTEALSSSVKPTPRVEKNEKSSGVDDTDLSLKLFGVKDTERDKAVKETEKFIEQSQYTRMLMNSYLNTNHGGGVNVFDNPELLLG